MHAGSELGISLSKVSPSFLHGNSTSHTWVFSAIAELIDNAYDPDAAASEFRIDVEDINGMTCLTFVDNGNGMDPDKLLKMLSFGFCEKDYFNQVKGTHAPIGAYGNGFKSGSMRLGRDAMVFTRQAATMSVGMLSQTYLQAVGAETVLVPIVTWKLPERLRGTTGATQNNLQAILNHSIFNTESQLLQEFESLQSEEQTTKIIIYNLRRLQNNAMELDLVSDPSDIRSPETQEFDRNNINRQIITVSEMRKSLREYCSVLYLKPRMKIYIKGKKVKTKIISKSLSHTEIDLYKPTWLEKPIKIIFGFTCAVRHEEDYGIMMYHRNRLIKAYEKVGYQKQPNDLGVGVVGVVQVDFLMPIHNKQDFNKDEKFNTLMQSLGIKLNDYWNEKKMGNTVRVAPNGNLPDWLWAQCDQCLKWRRLPDGVNSDSLPDKWFCYMNPDATHNRCDIEMEPEDEDEALSRPSYSKTYKKELEKKKQEQKLKAHQKQMEKERELKDKEERLRRLEAEKQQPHRFNVTAGAAANQINILQEKLQESRRREEIQKRKILMIEAEKKQLEEERKRTEEMVQGIRVVTMRSQSKSPAASTSGSSSTGRPRKRIRLTTENGEEIASFSQPSPEPVLVDLTESNEEDNCEAGIVEEDVKPDVNKIDAMMEAEQAARAEASLSPSSSHADNSRGTPGEEKVKEELQEDLRQTKRKLQRKMEELDKINKELEDAKKESLETRKQLASLQQNVHQLLQIIIPGVYIGGVENVAATITEMIQVNSEISTEPS